MRISALAATVVSLAALVPAVASAENVTLEVKVVEASVVGNAIDPALAHMKDDFSRHGFAYSSYRLIDTKRVTVPMKGTAEVALPNGKVARFTPEGREKKGSYAMHLEIPGLFDVRYSIGDGGTMFQGAGSNDHGHPDESQVILMVKHSSR